MLVYWNDNGDGPAQDEPEEMDLRAALLVWSDEIRGMVGNFLGLIDEQDRTVQFYFDDGIPDDVDDARHLRIVLMDFPRPDLAGSFTRQVTIGKVEQLIQTAYRVGADPEEFGELSFTLW